VHLRKHNEMRLIMTFPSWVASFAFRDSGSFTLGLVDLDNGISAAGHIVTLTAAGNIGSGTSTGSHDVTALTLTATGGSIGSVAKASVPSRRRAVFSGRMQELWTPYRFARSTARGQRVSSFTFEKICACWVCQTNPAGDSAT
jgi:hypothetical protein